MRFKKQKFGVLNTRNINFARVAKIYIVVVLGSELQLKSTMELLKRTNSYSVANELQAVGVSSKSLEWLYASKIPILYNNRGGVFEPLARYAMRYQESNLHLGLYSSFTSANNLNLNLNLLTSSFRLNPYSPLPLLTTQIATVFIAKAGHVWVGIKTR